MMTMVDITAAIKSLAENDQSISQPDINRWVDAGISRINQACQANFPQVTGQVTSYIPQFDGRYHDSLVIYATARYRESDGDYAGASYFMNQFETYLRDMQRDMYIPYMYRVDYNIQNIVRDEDAYEFTLTLPDSAYYGMIKVYITSFGNVINEKLLESKYYTINADKRTLTLSPAYTWNIDDVISVTYEANAAFETAPYTHWTW